MYKEKIYRYNNRDYLISNDGHVFIADGNKRSPYHTEVKQRLNKDGYLEVTLGETKHRNTKRVHQLVAELFVKKPNDNKQTYEVDHIDRNRINNHYSNLQWLTHSENVKRIPLQVQSNARKAEHNGRATFTWEQIRQIRVWYQQGYSIAEITRLVYGADIPYKYKWSTINNIVKNKTWVEEEKDKCETTIEKVS